MELACMHGPMRVLVAAPPTRAESKGVCCVLQTQVWPPHMAHSCMCHESVGRWLLGLEGPLGGHKWSAGHAAQRWPHL